MMHWVCHDFSNISIWYIINFVWIYNFLVNPFATFEIIFWFEFYNSLPKTDWVPIQYIIEVFLGSMNKIKHSIFVFIT